MTADQAAAILTATVGKPYYCLRYGKQWNVTNDPKGEGCEDLYAKPEDAIQAMVAVLGLMAFPKDWSEMDCLRLLPQCRPEGFLMQVKMADGTKRSTQPIQEDDMTGAYTKERQLGKGKKAPTAKAAAGVKARTEAKPPAAEKPKSADELRLAEVCKIIAKHASEITTLRAEKVALKKKLGQ